MFLTLLLLFERPIRQILLRHLCRRDLRWGADLPPLALTSGRWTFDVFRTVVPGLELRRECRG